MKETPEERMKEDIAMIGKIVGKISEVPENEIDNKVRLGQVRVGKNSKPKLQRLEVKSEKSKKSTMKNVYQLNTGMMGCIQKDLY